MILPKRGDVIHIMHCMHEDESWQVYDLKDEGGDSDLNRGQAS